MSILAAARRRAALPAVLAPLVLLFAACADDASDDDDNGPPAPVRVMEVQRTTVDRHVEYPGRARGAREVEVRARIEGILEERLYTEGAVVERDEVLFRIDPAPQRIAVQRAEAEVADARARVDEARRVWERISGLYERDATSTRERDSARSALDLAKANEAMARAGLADARLRLSYTEVHAPLQGVTGLERVPEGTLLEPGMLLTTIVQRDPLHLHFSLPERDALARRARQTPERLAETIDKAQLLLDDGSVYAHEGRIDFTNVSVDPATGTVSARAIFPNPDDVLRPGQFRRVRLLLERFEDVFAVPEHAIAEGEEGPVVYVVDDGKAWARTVALGPVIDGRQIVRNGLSDGERLVVSGLAGLADGDVVRIVDDDEG